MSFLAEPTLHGPLTRYVLPVVSVLLALQANWMMTPYLSVLPPFLAFLAAIMITAWYGGFRPALLAIVLSACITNYFFMGPIGTFTAKPAELAAIGVFVLEGIALAYSIDYLKRNEDRLRCANRELEHRVASEREQLVEKEERLRGLVSELAVTGERERQLLAVELHDYLAQLLTLARIKGRQAQQSLFHSPDDSHRQIGEIDELLHKSLDYVRTLMAELYPAELHNSGFPAALRSLAEQMPRHGLAVDLVMTGEYPTLPDHHALLLFQSVRELLMNIVKHAAVDRAVIALEVDGGQLLVTVGDTGRGFDVRRLPPTEAGKHFGLSSVRERIATLGGKLGLESVEGQGTTIRLSVPVQPLTASEVHRAANAARPDRVRATATGSRNQESLPL
jgi:signal transduction histidine kinase